MEIFFDRVQFNVTKEPAIVDISQLQFIKQRAEWRIHGSVEYLVDFDNNIEVSFLLNLTAFAIN